MNLNKRKEKMIEVFDKRDKYTFRSDLGKVFKNNIAGQGQ